MSNPRISVSLLCQWYEIKILPEYLYSLKRAIENYEGTIVLNFCLNINQDLEQIASGNIEDVVGIWHREVDILFNCENVEYNFTINKDRPLGIGEFRRNANIWGAGCSDVIMCGETDALVPSQSFNHIDFLYKLAKKSGLDKWIAFFSTCKMWDESWKSIEHPDFTDKEFDGESKENIWDLCHVTSYAEMEKFNCKEKYPNSVRTVWPQQFNGCNLMISSEVIKSGVNIPESMFFIPDDTAFMYMVRKHNITQFLFPYVYGPHNRKHPLKRYNIKNEEHIQEKHRIGKLRACQPWYKIAEQYAMENLNNLNNPDYKVKGWDDVLK